jgi:hypothetical protein
MIISAKLIRRPRRRYFCDWCGEEMSTDVVRLYGKAGEWDCRPYVLIAHPECIHESEWQRDPKLAAVKPLLDTPPPPPRFCYQSLDLREVATRHRRGRSIAAICQQLAIPDVQRVRRMLREAGYPVRGVREAAVVRWQKQAEGKTPSGQQGAYVAGWE